jgi:hypothetical protein
MVQLDPAMEGDVTRRSTNGVIGLDPAPEHGDLLLGEELSTNTLMDEVVHGVEVWAS